MHELETLKLLVEIDHLGSFSAAADALNYTQPAVSRRVARLERELGVALVDRSVRPVRLTEAGGVLIGRAEAILGELASARADLEAIAGLRAGQISVGSFGSAAPTIAAPAIAELSRRHPGLDVALTEGDRDELLQGVAGGDLDLALVYDFGELAASRPFELEHEPLLEDPYVLVTALDHRHSKPKRVTLRDLAQENWIFPSARSGVAGTYWRFMTKACAEAGFEPNVVFQINDCQTVQALVAARMGIAVLPKLTLRPVNPDVTIRPLDGAVPRRQIAAAWRARAPRPPALDELMDLLRAAAKLPEPVARPMGGAGLRPDRS